MTQFTIVYYTIDKDKKITVISQEKRPPSIVSPSDTLMQRSIEAIAVEKNIDPAEIKAGLYQNKKLIKTVRYFH